MATRTTGASPRHGALLALTLSAPLTTLLAHDASATPATGTAFSRGSSAQELAITETHPWAQGPGSALTPSVQMPSGTWLDGVHGPVLDGVLLSTPMLVLTLAAIVATALVMATRAARELSREGR